MLPTKTVNKSAANSTGAFMRAMKRFRTTRERVHIGLIIDATSSRAKTWEQAQKIQMRMFGRITGLGRLSLRLVHFGGYEVVDHGWQSDPKRLAAKMAAVRCVSGLTQILESLEYFIDDATPRANAIILIGDCFEECSEEAEHVARRLAARKTKVFSFLEGNEDPVAEAVFKRLAAVTGGKFARLGAELPLGDLCEGVALLAAGGEKAVKRLSNQKAQRLLLGGPSASK